jgi:hypothetical protein
MTQERDNAAAEIERLTALRDAAEKGSAEHRELNHRLMKARRRLYEVEGGTARATLSTVLGARRRAQRPGARRGSPTRDT